MTQELPGKAKYVSANVDEDKGEAASVQAMVYHSNLECNVHIMK